MALIGIANAATPGPTGTNSFPLYATQSAPAEPIAATYYRTKDTGGVYCGLYRAYRSNLTIFPVQTLAAVPTTDVKQTVTTAQTGTRTFW